MTPLPPKQGLKRCSPARAISYAQCYDTTSTKTRIETSPLFLICSSLRMLWHHFHQNKDWNAVGWVYPPIFRWLWHHFHQNKDWNSCGRYFFGLPTGVMTPLPPKQGLKLTQAITGSGEIRCYDTTSTKTRIETITFTKIFSYNALLWHHFHQNKDWKRKWARNDRVKRNSFPLFGRAKWQEKESHCER